jgi:ADP-L-glycero-D-manno-heptose 6-epimerase
LTAEVLVTGAAGFIGRHAALAFAAAGWRVTTLDVRDAAEDVKSQTRFIRADLCDPAVPEMVRGGKFKAVVHQAGISSTLEEDWSALDRVNVIGALRLASACAEAGARFIYASSHSVYGNMARRILVKEDAGPGECSGPLNLYAASKLRLDREIAKSADSLEWVGLRYTNVFGTGEEHKGRMASIISQLLRRAAACEPLTLFDDTLEACRDYIPVFVVADTCVRLAGQHIPAGVYNLGSGLPIRFQTVLEWCSDFLGAPIMLRLVPNPVVGRYQYWTGADMGKLRAALDGLPVTKMEDIRLAAQALFRDFQGSKAGAGEG